MATSLIIGIAAKTERYTIMEIKCTQLWDCSLDAMIQETTEGPRVDEKITDGTEFSGNEHWLEAMRE